MYQLNEKTIHDIYAGWLGKTIGVRLGAAIEGWTYERIQAVYGELTHYPVDYKNFAADDDTNGPLFFLTGLEQAGSADAMTPRHVAQALLNYAPYEHGFFWWGGYGISTEHTAYLNLRAGIPAPRSGSIAQNGAAVAEQIGGQIFIDTWGLVTPGNPALAAELAAKAASVMHGGNGIYGGIFIAVLISAAFADKDINSLLETALSYIPADCEYTRAARAVMHFHATHPEAGWRDCFQYVKANFGYDRYPGACHIIPNACVIILALLYGQGDFGNTLNICNMCGWDTDCNVGNLGAVMGVLVGIEGIDLNKWAKPINDLMICSSVMGDLNIQDLPWGASYIARLAFQLAGQQPPAPWDKALHAVLTDHFEYPSSTHVYRTRVHGPNSLHVSIENSDEQAYDGMRSLKVRGLHMRGEHRLHLYKQSYYRPEDFNDSRYDPDFSPTVYPGQRYAGWLYLPEGWPVLTACAYARDSRADQAWRGEEARLIPSQWLQLTLDIPSLSGGLIDEVGFELRLAEPMPHVADILFYLDEAQVTGQPDYTIDLSRESVHSWTFTHREVSQFSRLKGLSRLENDQLHLSCADYGEMYTGATTWQDYEARFTLTPHTGDRHHALVRVQGAQRCYAAGFDGKGRFALLKNNQGCYQPLAEAAFNWQHGQTYEVAIQAAGNKITASVGDVTLSHVDEESPWLSGAIGLGVRDGSHCALTSIRVN